MLCLSPHECVEYSDYPDDSQVINIPVESFAFKTNLLNISFTGEHQLAGFSLLPSVEVPSSDISPLWTYEGSSTEILYYDPAVPGFSRGVVYMTIQRQSTGIVYRLALPIMMLLLLGTFPPSPR